MWELTGFKVAGRSSGEPSAKKSPLQLTAASLSTLSTLSTLSHFYIILLLQAHSLTYRIRPRPLSRGHSHRPGAVSSQLSPP